MARSTFGALVAVGALLIAGTVATLESGADAASSSATWLQQINAARTYWNASVPTVTEDANLSANDLAHATYLENKGPGVCEHAESGPTATAGGNDAGNSGVIFCGPVDFFDPVDSLIRSVLHGEQVLNPRLTVSGYGETANHAVIDTLHHHDAGPAVTQPMTWPNGVGVPFLDSIPDFPAANCAADYSAPGVDLGVPLFVILPGGAFKAAPVSDSDVYLRDSEGVSQPICIMDSRLTAPGTRQPGFSTAILQPLHKLRAGELYSAQYKAGGYTATWAFSTGGGASTPTPSPSSTATPSPAPSASPAPQRPSLMQSNKLGTVTLTLTTVVIDESKTVYFFRKSGMTGKVVPLGTGMVNPNGKATRVFNAARGQILALYGKVIGSSLADPYSNLITFKVA